LALLHLIYTFKSSVAPTGGAIILFLPRRRSVFIVLPLPTLWISSADSRNSAIGSLEVPTPFRIGPRGGVGGGPEGVKTPTSFVKMGTVFSFIRSFSNAFRISSTPVGPRISRRAVGMAEEIAAVPEFMGTGPAAEAMLNGVRPLLGGGGDIYAVGSMPGDDVEAETEEGADIGGAAIAADMKFPMPPPIFAAIVCAN